MDGSNRWSINLFMSVEERVEETEELYETDEMDRDLDRIVEYG